MPLGLFKGIQNGRCGWSVREIPVLNPLHLLRTSVLIVGSLSCFAASAQTYPISGVWVTMDQRFPGSKTGACLTLKTLGADALFDRPFPTVMIFSVGERFVVRGGRSAKLAIRSVEVAKDGSFHITESLGKRGGWLPWFKN